MERQPTNALDERISRMVEGLRTEEMPRAPHSLLTGQPIQRKPMRGRRLILVGSGVAGIAIAGTLMLPRESAAAELDRIAQTTENVLRHELSYRKQADGTWQIGGDYYVDGTRFHSIPHSEEAEQFVGDGRIINYFRKAGYATIEHYGPKVYRLFYRSSMKRQLGFEHVKSATRAGIVEWKGMRLQRFNIHSEFKDALDQLLSSDGYLLADPATDRPYYQEFTITGDQKGPLIGGQTSAIIWEYPQGEEAKLALDLPQGTRVYDIEKLREQVRKQVAASLQTTTVNGIQVTLRAVYADEPSGWLNVFTSGGTGRIEEASNGLRLDGKEVPAGSSRIQNHGHWAGGSFSDGGRLVYEPLRYGGIDLVYQTADFGDVPERFDLDVPVWKPDGSRFGRSFVGYAKFKNVVPVRIAGQVLSVLNRSILWTDKDIEIENTNRDDSKASSNRN